MKTHRIGIIMNGVTGRMGANQHLVRSIAAIIKQGGVKISDDEVIMPDPILVGRSEGKLRKVADLSGVNPPCSTNLVGVLSDSKYSVYFDAQTTDRRCAAVKQAIAAGKHIYCEKPTATNTADALGALCFSQCGRRKKWRGARQTVAARRDETQAIDRHGILRPDLSVVNSVTGFLKGMRYRRNAPVGIIAVKMPEASSLICSAIGVICWTTFSETLKRYPVWGQHTSSNAGMKMAGPMRPLPTIPPMPPLNWTTASSPSSTAVGACACGGRLLTLQVDGTQGSAVAGLRQCVSQQYNNTPRPVWNPDVDQPINFFNGWSEVPSQQIYDNAFKVQWELFLKHLVRDNPFPWSLLEAAKGVQLAEKGLESWRKRAWVDVPALKA